MFVQLEKAKEQAQDDEDQSQTQSQASESPLSAAEGPKKPGRRKKVATPPAAAEPLDLEKASPIKKVARARSKAKALAKAQAQAEAEAQAALAAKRQAERRAQAQRRMEERKRQQLILEEMKKPAEDMCLPDHTVSLMCWGIYTYYTSSAVTNPWIEDSIKNKNSILPMSSNWQNTRRGAFHGR